MSVLIVACLEVRDPEKVAEYFAVTMPLIEAAQAKILDRMEIGEPVVGEPPGESIMVVEYPNIEAVDSVFQSEAYKSITDVRDAAFSKYSISFLAA